MIRLSRKIQARRAAFFAALTPLAFGLAACGVDPGTPTSTAVGYVQAATSALSDPTAILGFEDATLWTTSSGTESASTTHSQGAKSLALQNFTFTTVTSAPLATLSGVTSTLQLDVRPPASLPWGTIQLFVSIPSRNIYNATVSSASLMNLSSTQFSTLSFPVPPTLVTALQQSYSDLTFQITINAPQ